MQSFGKGSGFLYEWVPQLPPRMRSGEAPGCCFPLLSLSPFLSPRGHTTFAAPAGQPGEKGREANFDGGEKGKGYGRGGVHACREWGSVNKEGGPARQPALNTDTALPRAFTHLPT